MPNIYDAEYDKHRRWFCETFLSKSYWRVEPHDHSPQFPEAWSIKIIDIAERYFAHIERAVAEVGDASKTWIPRAYKTNIDDLKTLWEEVKTWDLPDPEYTYFDSEGNRFSDVMWPFFKKEHFALRSFGTLTDRPLPPMMEKKPAQGELTVNTAALIDALDKLIGHMPPVSQEKSEDSSLGMVYLKQLDKGLQMITAVDYLHTEATQMPWLRSTGFPLRAVVYARPLRDWLKTVVKGYTEVTLRQLDNGSVNIILQPFGRSQATFKGYDIAYSIEELHKNSCAANVPSLSADRIDKAGFSWLKKAGARKDKRPALCFAHTVTLLDGTLCAATTDGYRLHILSLPDMGGEEEGKWVVLDKKYPLTMLDKDTRFPTVDAILPNVGANDWTGAVQVEADRLIKFLKPAIKIAKDDADKITVSIRRTDDEKGYNACLEVFAHSPERGSWEGAMPVNLLPEHERTFDSARKYALAGRYLQDAVMPKTKADLYFRPNAPIYVEGENRTYRAVIMHMESRNR